MKTAYRDFTAQHPYPVPGRAPYTPISSKHQPGPPLTGQVPPLILLLAPNKAKVTQTTVIRHGAKWCIPKHHMTTQDLPRSPTTPSKGPCTWWGCDPKAPTTTWPVLHLIARRHTHPTARLPPSSYAWVAPWFHQPNTDPTVAWNQEHNPQWLFTTTPTWPRPDATGIAFMLQHARSRTTNTYPHMPKPEPGHRLHPTIHLLLPHTRTTGTRTLSRVPPAGNASSPKEWGCTPPPSCNPQPRWPTSPGASPYTPTCA